LSRFNFILKHIPESKIGKVDSLSRRLDWEVGVEKDNEDKTLVKQEWLEVRKMETAEIIVDRVDLLEEVRKSKVKDNEVVKAVEKMKRAGVKILRNEGGSQSSARESVREPNSVPELSQLLFV